MKLVRSAKATDAFALSALLMLLTGCETGYHGQHDSWSRADYPPPPPSQSTPAPPGPRYSTPEPWVEVSITASERQIIQNYVAANGAQEGNRGKGRKAKSLPPGLQKKLDRGGSLPPGWETKLRKGEILPAEVYENCHPLPSDLFVKLPTPPAGTVLVAIGGKVVRLLAATREILDVFDVVY